MNVLHRLNQDGVIELLTAVVTSDCFNLETCYCSERFFDAPTSVITVTLDGASHTVTHLKGDEAPEGLLSLEEAIGRVSGSDRWVKAPSDPNGSRCVASRPHNR